MSKIIDIKEERNKISKKKIIMDIIFLVILIYIIYAIYLIIKTPTDTVTIESGTLTVEESATGYIIRDEIVVQGKKYKNGINQIVLEGEKAAKKQTIFRYYGKSEDELQEKISNVEVKIQEAMEKEKSMFPTDLKNLDEQIDGKLQNLQNTTDVQTLAEYKKQISDIMIKKAKIAGENSKSGSYIKKLIDQREQYEKQLIDGSEYITAPISGVVSYRVDGLENVLKPKDFNKITSESLEKLDVKTGKIISTSNESAKIIDNFGCYIAAILDVIPDEKAEEGNIVQITLASGDEIPGTIHYIKKQKDGKYLVVFKLNTLTEELISYRKISFNITWWSEFGIKVPNSSILEDENKLKYVMKRTITGGTTKCLIKVLKTNNNYSIISPYTNEDLQALGIDISTYKKIEVHDTIMMYPEK